MNNKLWQLFASFFRIGAFTFGGGYAMIAILENEFVERKKWLEHEEFMDIVAIAESTPGPIAINSATYIGYKLMQAQMMERMLAKGLHGPTGNALATDRFHDYHAHLGPVVEGLEVEQVDNAHHTALGRFDHQP